MFGFHKAELHRGRVLNICDCCREHDVSVARGASVGHDSCIGAHTVIDEDAQARGDTGLGMPFLPNPYCLKCLGLPSWDCWLFCRQLNAC